MCVLNTLSLTETQSESASAAMECAPSHIREGSDELQCPTAEVIAVSQPAVHEPTLDCDEACPASGIGSAKRAASPQAAPPPPKRMAVPASEPTVQPSQPKLPDNGCPACRGSHRAHTCGRGRMSAAETVDDARAASAVAASWLLAYSRPLVQYKPHTCRTSFITLSMLPS